MYPVEVMKINFDYKRKTFLKRELNPTKFNCNNIYIYIFKMDIILNEI